MAKLNTGVWYSKKDMKDGVIPKNAMSEIMIWSTGSGISLSHINDLKLIEEIWKNEKNKEKRRMMLNDMNFQKFYLIKEPVNISTLGKTED